MIPWRGFQLPTIEPVAPDAELLPAIGDDDQAAAEGLTATDVAPALESVEFSGMSLDPDLVLLGSLVIAGSISAQTADGQARNRMEIVVREQLAHLQSELGLTHVSPAGTLQRMAGDLTPSLKTMLLIELTLTNPFAPYEHDWTDAQRAAGLAYIERTIGAEPGTAGEVLDTFADAIRAHHRVSLRRIGFYSVGAAALLGGAGFMAAPMVGAMFGSAAGLSGAAATSHGLALIGGLGGSTPSMAAGTWLLAQAGAAAGATSAAFGTVMFQMGAAQTQAELIKLQVASKLILVDLQRNDAAAHQVAARLRTMLEVLEQRIEEEAERNAPESERLQILRAQASATADSQAWIEAHCSDADGSLTISMYDLRADLEALSQGTTRSRLDESALARAKRTIEARFSKGLDLDRYDVLAAIAAGVVGAVIDGVVVATPTTSVVTTRLREGLATKSDSWLARESKVPFDQSIGNGFTPNNHRALTAGHDPLVGLVWGVWDILGSTMTRSTTVGGMDVVEHLGSASLPAGAMGAVARELAHLVSDIVTPAGLPLPGWTPLVMAESTSKTAVKMYTKGYDTWHLPSMTLPIAAVNIVARVYWSMRTEHDPEFAARRNKPDSDPRFESLLLLADAVACSGDIVELLMTAGNPLVVNWSHWLTLARRIATVGAASLESPTSVLIAGLQDNQRRLDQSWEL